MKQQSANPPHTAELVNPFLSSSPAMPVPPGRTTSSIIELLCGRTALSNRTFWGLCIAIFLVAFGLRLITLQSRALSLDETYSVWFATRPWLELWHVVPLYETHPPMYYSLLKIWTQWFGISETAVRMLSVAASMATVLLVATSGKLFRAGPAVDRVGLVAALLLATNKGNILFAELARPYALETFVAALAILCSVIVLRHLTARPEATADGPSMPYAATVTART
jgi:4-amino-4-deoxy-L-arabinose transferase-like glycosyltransferase